jgi:ssDNA-binding Zn-finger/Zn-ribbon topoisomerase 1
MGGIRCPECGGRTTLRTSKVSDIKYYVCINYPKCKGMVPIEGSVYTEIGGGRSMGRPRMEDMRRQRDEHTTKGMVLADESPTNIWNKGDYTSRAASTPSQRKKTLNLAAGTRKGEFSKTRWPGSAEAAEYRARRQGERVSPDGGAVRAISNPVKDERGSAHGAGRPVRRRDASDSSWGDDWNDDSPAPKAVSERPARRAVVEAKAPAGEKKPLSPRRKTVPAEAISARKKESPESRRKKVPKAAPAKPRRPQEPELVDDEFKQMESTEEAADAGGRKRSPLVIIIALAVAFLAIDGIIFAAIKLVSD